jgi:hypothetical protein
LSPVSKLPVELALGAEGQPDFHLLQNLRSAESAIVYYVFDILKFDWMQDQNS